jgi:hypothetical protein
LNIILFLVETKIKLKGIMDNEYGRESEKIIIEEEQLNMWSTG